MSGYTNFTDQNRLRSIYDDYTPPEDAVVSAPNTQQQKVSLSVPSGGASDALSGAAMGGQMAQLAGVSGPYGMAAGAALGVLAAKEKRKQQEEMAKYEAEENRKARIQGALTSMADLYGRMKL